MSYGVSILVPALGEPVTNSDAIKKQVTLAWESRMKTYTSIDKILQAQDGETWTSLVIRGLIDTLCYDGSLYGNFGTPDQDILNGVKQSGNGKNLWVKLLGIKMRVLLGMLDDIAEMSSTQKDRIRKIDTEFRKIFPEKGRNIS